MWWAVYAFWISLLAVSAAAWQWGGRAEKRAAAMYLAAALLTLIVRFPGTSRYQAFQLWPAVIDVALLMGLILLASRVDRWWPIWSAAIQGTTVLGHVAKIEAAATPLGYFMTVVGSAFPSLILLTMGIFNHTVRTKRDGIGRSGL